MDVIKTIAPAVLTFVIGFAITPLFTHFFYKYKMWKKSARTNNTDGVSDTFAQIHNTNHELSTPRIGGMIIWVAVFLTVAVVYLLSKLVPFEFLGQLNFFSRSQTLVPLGAFFLAALIGLADDLLQIFGRGSYARDPLIYRKIKIVLITLIGLAIASWFYFKLDFVSIYVPFVGFWQIGWWFIPVFVVVVLATFSSSVIDGLDGLSGGVLASCFFAFAVIAFLSDQYDISALSGAITGGILAFLWFNIPPARFYMGETGMLSLTVVLAVLAFLTNSVLLLPVIGLPLVATSASVIIQTKVYKYFGHRRIFRVAPLHHHFQALGWPREKVVMRYWVVSIICAVTGIILFVVS